MPPRIGLGFDSHRLVAGTGFRLGGIEVQCDFAVDAHSDGDVLLHALVDALFGAAGLGDIGDHFPNTNERWRDADSRLFVAETMKRITEAGFTVGNVDANVFLDEPKLGPLKEAMLQNIAQMLEVDPAVVSVKAKTLEGLGLRGDAPGLAAQAAVILHEREEREP